MIEEVNEKHIKWTSTSLNDAYCVFYKDIKTALDQHEGDNRDTISKTLLDAIKRSKEKNDIIVKDIYPTFIHLFPEKKVKPGTLQARISRLSKNQVTLDKVIELLFLIYLREHAPEKLRPEVAEEEEEEEEVIPPPPPQKHNLLLPLLIGAGTFGLFTLLYAWFGTQVIQKPTSTNKKYESNISRHLESERDMVALLSKFYLFPYEDSIAFQTGLDKKIISVNAWQKQENGFYVIGDSEKGLARVNNQWEKVKDFGRKDTSVISFVFKHQDYTVVHKFAKDRMSKDTSYAFYHDDNGEMILKEKECCLFGKRTASALARLYMVCQAQKNFGLCINFKIPENHPILKEDLSPVRIATWSESISVFKKNSDGSFTLFDDLIKNLKPSSAREQERAKEEGLLPSGTN